MKNIRVLSVDPGTQNFAIAVVDIRYSNETIVYRILKTAMVENTILDLKDSADIQMRKFVKEFRSYALSFKPTHFICERFQSRGLKGLTIECVNMMIGAMVTRTTVPIKLVTASTWKNSFNRADKLQDLYRESSVVPHVVDATCLGLYQGYLVYGLKPFSDFTRQRTITLSKRLYSVSV